MGSIPAYSFLKYSKQGDKEHVQRSVWLMNMIKRGRVQVVEEYLTQVIEEDELFQKHMESNTTLVPIPRSARLVKNASWPSLEICKKLIGLGVGREIANILERVKSVNKAAFQKPEDRPTVQDHLDTIKCGDHNPLERIESFTLVDDFITMGSISSACCLLLKDKYPNIPIKVFTLMRTMYKTDIESVFEPNISSVIYYPSGKTFVDHNSNQEGRKGRFGLF